MGFGDKAAEIYRMINPIEHSRTRESVQKYKVEPYVVPADVYGAFNLVGRRTDGHGIQVHLVGFMWLELNIF